MDKRCRRHLKPTNKSCRLDETVKGHERCLYRAVDPTGQTIDFLLIDKRDATAAKRFFRRTLAQTGNSMPRAIIVDRNSAYRVAVEGLKQEVIIRRRCQLRQCKYLHNVVEQDHRNVKRRTWLGNGIHFRRECARVLDDFGARPQPHRF